MLSAPFSLVEGKVKFAYRRRQGGKHYRIAIKETVALSYPTVLLARQIAYKEVLKGKLWPVK